MVKEKWSRKSSGRSGQGNRQEVVNAAVHSLHVLTHSALSSLLVVVGRYSNNYSIVKNQGGCESRKVLGKVFNIRVRAVVTRYRTGKLT